MNNSDREKAIALVNAYFDNKEIIFKDPVAGIENWTSTQGVWTYLDTFCRNLHKYKIIEPKQEKFDPKTLQPFDKVLVKLSKENYDIWTGDFVSEPNIGSYRPYTMINKGDGMIIPYNNDTKHLIGTSQEAPEFYRYWEE